MNKSTIPSLHLNTNLLYSVPDILAYVIRHYLYVPSGIYENYILEEISFAKVFAKCGDNIELLKETIHLDLMNVFQRHFEDKQLVIVVDSTDDGKAVTLSIDIQISDDDGLHSVTPQIIIDNATNKFEIDFSDIIY